MIDPRSRFFERERGGKVDITKGDKGSSVLLRIIILNGIFDR